MYSLSSASHTREPFPRTMYGGSPPTDLKARTGESTPPGITRQARACSSCDFDRLFILPLNISLHFCHRFAQIHADKTQRQSQPRSPRKTRILLLIVFIREIRGSILSARIPDLRRI